MPKAYRISGTNGFKVKDYEEDKDAFNKLPINNGSFHLIGSSQFTRYELDKIIEEVKKDNSIKKFYIVDMREESHFFINGKFPISYRSPHNNLNHGQNSTEVENTMKSSSFDEVGMIHKQEKKKDGKSAGKCNKALGKCEIDLTYKIKDEIKSSVTVQTEAELIANVNEEYEGLTIQYQRFPITDHGFITYEIANNFINFLDTVDFTDSALLFHCKGGKGRTTTALAITEKFLFLNETMDNILKNQKTFGGSNLKYKSKDTWKDALANERYEALKCFDTYKDKTALTTHNDLQECLEKAASLEKLEAPLSYMKILKDLSGGYNETLVENLKTLNITAPHKQIRKMIGGSDINDVKEQYCSLETENELCSADWVELMSFAKNSSDYSKENPDSQLKFNLAQYPEPEITLSFTEQDAELKIVNPKPVIHTEL